ncbi:hypothetical protein OAD06_07830 [Flavobacteriaceae bacterium]|jgi:hypothetical protein|nr:hypothetical protein [Flavobacteriaceae bacterium]|tara:strand:+ start:3298 stop:3426 length:129 start_codon:yes stop_codon:yes gene_type:complete
MYRFLGRYQILNVKQMTSLGLSTKKITNKNIAITTVAKTRTT